MGEKKEIVGVSSHLKELRKKIKSCAKKDWTVLVQGPTGVGKELVANNIHYESERKKNLFVPVDCAAIPENLLESELFGHEKGAFTGAISKKIGKFELADEGTIFLDEIGDMTPNLQAKLLRVLQEKEFWRVGGTKAISMKARVIASTNKDLLGEIKDGHFREDLYHRLSQFVIRVEPLFDRPEDIICLTNYCIYKNRVKKVDPRIKFLLYAYDWPGNVRELENIALHDFPYVKEALERNWNPKRQEDRKKVENQEEELFLPEEENADRFKKTIEFVESTGVDFKKYIEIYEILMLKEAGLGKTEICRVLHLRKEKVFDFKKNYGYEWDLTEKDFYLIFEPLDVYPYPKTVSKTYPSIFEKFRKGTQLPN
jgi:transcriptional regulator with GAF, ATPase, and Fis domain